MDLGICLPYMERDYDRERHLAWCRLIDAGPFASLSCGERITGYTMEMRALLSSAAVLTSRVRLMPSLYVLPMHSAVWAAKEIATLDVLSAGRVELCVGVGAREHDYRAVGASFTRRHERLDEQVAEMRRIWRGSPPFDGADEVGPRPFRVGGPSILAGAMGPKAIARAANWADGLYAFSVEGAAEGLAEIFRQADDAWQAAGRSERPRRVAGFWYSLADDAQTRLRDYVYHYLRSLGEAAARAIAADLHCFEPSAILGAIEGMRAIGCDELMLVPASAELAEVEGTTRLAEGFLAR